jgi:pilus assembly protein CpaE
MSVLSEHSSGVRVLSPPPKLPENYTVKSHDLEILLREMQDIFDFVVIDGGQLLNDSSDAIMKMADKVVLVSVLNLPTIINLKLLLGAFRKRGYPDEKNVEIIANRFLKDSEISLKELEESVKKKVLCCIPNAYYVFMGSLNEGNPICAQTKGSRKETELCRVFGELASTFAGKSVEKKKGGFFSRK